MIDVAGNLFNALPQSYGVGSRTIGSGFALEKPDESLASGDSLRAVTAGYREDSGLPDFSEKPKNEQGFLSLGPVLASLRPDPQPVEPIASPLSPLSEEPTTWEKLLEESKRISESQSERQKQTREFLNAQQSSGEDIASLTASNSDRVLLEIDVSEEAASEEPAGQAAASRAAQLSLNAQRVASQETEPVIDDNEPELEPVELAPLPGQGERIDSPYQSEEAFAAPPVFGADNTSPADEANPELPSQELPGPPGQEQQRLQQSYSAAPGNSNAGGNVDFYI